MLWNPKQNERTCFLGEELSLQQFLSLECHPCFQRVKLRAIAHASHIAHSPARFELDREEAENQKVS
jgi:hypothetical protein